ncbi:MAG: NAD(P)H-dependent oxidoreductase [Bacteroidetes bacterium]|nr:NAD(P)H-dependent oxidoreductase [Bacteroidota bacterium]
MKILIIHAHPEPASFNTALKNKALDFFSARGDEVKVSDLYEINFNPVGGKLDFQSLSRPDYFKYQTEQVNAWQHNLFSPDVQDEMDKVVWADLIIFNFPLWWFSLPAILKGWVDRVFAMGFCYGAGKGVYNEGFFREKKAMLTITTGGPETAYGPAGRNGDLDKILFHINHGMLYFTGMSVIPPFVAYAPVRITAEQRADYLLQYEQRLMNLEVLTPVY